MGAQCPRRGFLPSIPSNPLSYPEVSAPTNEISPAGKGGNGTAAIVGGISLGRNSLLPRSIDAGNPLTPL